jgi:hypothetical protein
MSTQEFSPEPEKSANETVKPGTALEEVDAESEGSSDSGRPDSIGQDLRNAITSGIDSPVVTTQVETSMNTPNESSVAVDDESAL